MDKLVMTSEAARLLGRSAESVRSYERSGRLPALKTSNGRRLFWEADVKKLATELSDKDSGPPEAA